MSYSTSYGDPVKTISITSTFTMPVEDSCCVTMLNALAALNSAVPISTVVTVSGATTVTAKDARTFEVTVTGTDPATATYEITSGTSSWLMNEFTLLQNYITTVNTMIFRGTTAMTITFA